MNRAGLSDLPDFFVSMACGVYFHIVNILFKILYVFKPFFLIFVPEIEQVIEYKLKI